MMHINWNSISYPVDTGATPSTSFRHYYSPVHWPDVQLLAHALLCPRLICIPSLYCTMWQAGQK